MLRHCRQNNPPPLTSTTQAPSWCPSQHSYSNGENRFMFSLEFLYLPFKAFCFYLQFAHGVDETYI